MALIRCRELLPWCGRRAVVIRGHIWQAGRLRIRLLHKAVPFKTKPLMGALFRLPMRCRCSARTGHAKVLRPVGIWYASYIGC